MLRPSSSVTPSIVAWLGYGGLIPFVALAAATVVGGDYAPLAGRGLLTYGAVILSFVGAINWGFAMTLGTLSERRRTQLWIWSVIPALVAWVALFLLASAASAALVVCFIVQYWQDRRLAREAALAAWFIPLRLRLTIGASVSLTVGALVSSVRGPVP
jgi:tellurite resistance protein TehA-like permease